MSQNRDNALGGEKIEGLALVKRQQDVASWKMEAHEDDEKDEQETRLRLEVK